MGRKSTLSMAMLKKQKRKRGTRRSSGVPFRHPSRFSKQGWRSLSIAVASATVDQAIGPGTGVQL